jgi:hypothetical protein
MIIETLSISELKPAPYNPRLALKPGDKAWEKLERSLDEFELVQPIVWNRNTSHIVSGHQRLAVLKNRGEKEVDCVVVDLSLEKEKALNVTLNNASVGSDWDAAKLVDLVSELQSLPEFDATLTGFDDQQLSDLVLAPAWDDGSSTEDESELDQDIVRVTLEVPRDEWDGVRVLLDGILAEHPTTRLHVNL